MDPKNMAILSMMGGPMMHQGGQMGITTGMIEISRRNIPVLKSPSGPLAEQPTPFKMSDSEMKAKIA